MKSNKKKKSSYIPAKKKEQPKLGKLILQWLASRVEVTFLKDLFEAFSDLADNADLNQELIELEAKGKINIQKRGIIALGSDNTGKRERAPKGKPQQVKGIADVTMSGAAYVIVEGLANDVFIAPRNTHHAMQGDEVLVNITKFGKRLEGEIVEILRHSQESFIGRIELLQKFAFCIPEEKSLNTDIFVPIEKLNGAKHGDRVIVRVTQWPEGDKNPIGEVTEVVSDQASSDLDYKLILIKNGFHPEFPAAVVEQTKKISENISPAILQKRLDLRDAITFTIDPEDAKDFDDAISVRYLENGAFEIGVHIADVAHYLPEGSPMDKEAALRATSVYLPGKVCPMLPEKLSNLICSLRPKEDKLTFSVLFTFDAQDKITSYQIAETIIHSDQRFSYEDAQQIIETGNGVFKDELLLLHRISKQIRKKRFEQGAIAFEKDEVRFKLDENGWPVGVYLKTRKDAHLLIEDFMLLANETIARFASVPGKSKTPLPFVYRVHDKPDPAKLEQFSNVAARFGYHIRFDKNTKVSAVFNELLKKVQGKPEQHVLETMAIRTMAKAAYTTNNIGHYGLAMQHYTHFTSPIRRYPDVMVHRLVKNLLQADKQPVDKGELESDCKKSSVMERKAMDAEWEAIRLKQVQYLKDKAGMTFDAIISGVISKGVFAEIIENKCEGFISLEALGNESYVYDERNVCLVSKRGKKYSMGDPIRIVVGVADPVMKRVDFLLA